MSQPFRPASARRPATIVGALCAGFVLHGLALSPTARATEVKLFRADTREAFLEGELDGVAIEPLGAISLAEALIRSTSIEEPFVYAMAAHADGWVIGTGASGRVLMVDTKGAVRTLFETESPNVFAVTVAGNGDIYAASSPDGAVYRLAAGSDDAEVIFDPEATYVWRLAIDPSGGLLVATGLPGHLYRIPSVAKSGRGAPELLLDSGDIHVRSLAVDGAGTIFAGTAGRGRIVRLASDGKRSRAVKTIYDGIQPEVVDLAVAPDGTLYAALLASEASLVDLSRARANGNDADKSKNESGETSVKVDVQGQSTIGSRPAGASGARSTLIAIDGEGAIESLWSHASDSIHDLLWSDGGLWIGTGEDGRLFRWRGEHATLEHDLESRQITALARREDGRVGVATTNDAALSILGAKPAARGIYLSDVLDAGAVADFGSFFFESEQPAGSGIEITARSGMANQPDGTWSDWTEIAGEGKERSLAALPAGRFIQWRATLLSGDASDKKRSSPRIESAEISYRQRNQAPKITAFEVLAPGQILVESSFSPQNQAYEPWSPNRDGIFTQLKPSNGKDDSGRLKPLWKRGYRTLRWEAEDPNQDDLRYRLEFRSDTADGSWLPMAESLTQTHFSFDATVLPDGVYRFRVTVDDDQAQGDHIGLEDAESSPAAVVDHTPPEIVAKRRTDGGFEVEIADHLNPVRAASWSADGQAWKPARATDGLVDGRRETFRVEAPGDAGWLLLRVMDAAFNVVTFNLLAD